MMKKRSAFVGVLGLFGAALALAVTTSRDAPAQQPQARHVILVSIDGGKPAALNKARMPVLAELVKAGAFSTKALTIVPSITLPSHTSMITSVPMEVHGISWNDYMPQLGLVKVPTMFGLAKQARLTTALFATKDKFRHLDVPGTLDHFQYQELDAPTVALAAAEYFVAKKPNLMMVHFRDADEAGHMFTWESPQQLRALEGVDRGLGILRQAIHASRVGGSTLLIITADHGGKGFTHSANIPENREIPWIAVGAGVRSGTVLPDGISTMDTPATLLWYLGVPRPQGWQGRPVLSAFQQRRP